MVERELLTHEELSDGVRTDAKPLANVLMADQVPVALARGPDATE
jgi:hypothetical protein